MSNLKDTLTDIATGLTLGLVEGLAESIRAEASQIGINQEARSIGRQMVDAFLEPPMLESPYTVPVELFDQRGMPLPLEAAEVPSQILPKRLTYQLPTNERNK